MNRLFFKSQQSKTSLLPAFALTFLSTFVLANQALAETGAHHQAYLDALDTVVAADTRIAREMNRISNGTVAHFDFLQHEHIELLRHASALRHPPSSMSAAKQSRVITDATALVIAAESLELVISDFLRAQALLNSAVSNTLDLVDALPKQQLSNEDLKTLQQLENATTVFGTDNTLKTRQAVYAAFDKVASIDTEPTWQSELSMQRQLIINNAAEAAAGVSKLATAQLAKLAKALQATYLTVAAD